MVDASHSQGVQVGSHNEMSIHYGQHQLPDLGALSSHGAAAKVRELSRDDAVVALARMPADDAAEILGVVASEDAGLAVSLLARMNRKLGREVAGGLPPGAAWLARLPEVLAAMAKLEHAVPLGRRIGEVERVGPSPQNRHGWVQRYRDNVIYCTEQPLIVSAGILRYHQARGGITGRFGFPVGQEFRTLSQSGAIGACQRFEGRQTYPGEVLTGWSEREGQGGATIYHLPAYGTRSTWAAIGACHEREDGARGWLGFPMSDEIDGRESPDEEWRCYQLFEGGAVYWTPEHGAVALPRPVSDLLLGDAAVAGQLGFPTAPAQTLTSDDRIHVFERGIVTVRQDVAEAWLPAGATDTPSSVQFEPETDISQWALSPSGSLVVTAGETVIRVLSTADGRLLRDLTTDVPLYGTPAVNGAGNMVAVETDEDAVVVWDLAGAPPSWSWRLPISTETHVLAFSPTGTLAIAGSEVRQWDPVARTETAAPVVTEQTVQSIAYSPDGRTLAIGASGVRLVGDGIDESLDHADEGRCLAFSPDGRLLAAAGATGHVTVWSVDGLRTVVATFQHGTAAIGAVGFSLDGEVLVSISQDDTLRFWDPVLGVQIGDMTAPDGHNLLAIAFTRDELTVLADETATGTPTIIRVPLGPTRLAQAGLRRQVAQGLSS